MARKNSHSNFGKMDWFAKPKSGAIKEIVDRAVKRSKTEKEIVGAKL